jgi:PAS domain S-box-containing protein
MNDPSDGARTHVVEEPMSLPHVDRRKPGIGSEAEFLRSVLASSGDCIKVLDLDGNLRYMTDVALELMEVSDFNALQGCPWPDFWRDGLNAEAIAAVDLARCGGEGRFEGEALTFAGTPKWWDVRVTPIRSASGEPEALLVVSREITKQKNAEAQQHLLALEMAHRVKNILAVVQAIAGMSLRDGADIKAARENFNGRLSALAKAQDLLLRSTAHSNVSASQLLANLLVIHGNASQLTWDGPNVVFGSAFGLSFSLVIHELYTNALKYGALSNGDGYVSIGWSISGTGPDATIELEWREIGGPAVVPPTRRGFGSRLIEQSLVKANCSSVAVNYAPDGIRFVLSARLSYVVEG